MPVTSNLFTEYNQMWNMKLHWSHNHQVVPHIQLPNLHPRSYLQWHKEVKLSLQQFSSDVPWEVLIVWINGCYFPHGPEEVPHRHAAKPNVGT